MVQKIDPILIYELHIDVYENIPKKYVAWFMNKDGTMAFSVDSTTLEGVVEQIKTSLKVMEHYKINNNDNSKKT